MASLRCWQCNAPLDLLAGVPVSRTESCPECDADIRSCRGCAYFDASNQTCNEPTAEPPSDRERANFCSAYHLATAPTERGTTSPTSASDEAKRRLEALFAKN